MLGSSSFRRLIEEKRSEPTYPRKRVAAFFKVLVEPHMLLSLALLVSGISLLLIACVPHEIGVYIGFLVFEACNGIYLPSIAYQRGLIIKATNRAGLYGLMQLPLYIFVIVALCTTGEGMLPRIREAERERESTLLTTPQMHSAGERFSRLALWSS